MYHKKSVGKRQRCGKEVRRGEGGRGGKRSAAAGNRTRGARLGSAHVATTPLLLLCAVVANLANKMIVTIRSETSWDG